MKNSFETGFKFISIVLLILSCSTSITAQNPKIEYIAHSAFVIESVNGTRVLIDPYHSYRQMGFTFPEDVKADVTLITHPHYDHDASMYMSENSPVYREAGEYHFKDISFKGIASKHSHAERIAKSGNQSYNTIWVVTVGTTKIAHLGDNDVLTKDELEKLAGVDYVIGHPNDEHFAKFNDFIYIPNHYLLPEITKHVNWMQPVDGWLKEKEGVVRLKSNVLHLDDTKNTAKILVFKPSPYVKEWSQNYYDALTSIKDGNALMKESENVKAALIAMDKAISLVPYVMDGYLNKAQLLSKKQDTTAIIAVLERAFTNVPDMDWGTKAKAHKLLADAYSATNQKELAYHHYVWLNRHKRIVNVKVQEQASAFIKKYNLGR